MSVQPVFVKTTMLATVLVATVLLNACHSPAEPQPKVTQQQLHDVDSIIELAVGQSTSLAGTPLTITFVNVPEDSRCPVDAVCVWAGNGRATLAVDPENGPADTLWLNTGLEPNAVEIYPGYELRLLSLLPYPELDVTIDPESYRVTLQLSALPENNVEQ